MGKPSSKSVRAKNVLDGKTAEPSLKAASSGDKRQRIMRAAEKIMVVNGMAEASISEIAKTAGVVDSEVYHFFRGKQDLLFSIPDERMKQVLSQLREYLAGIVDPVSRLRKMIWFHLKFNDKHRGYARLLIMECRSSKDFYSSEAYKLIRSYTGILMEILDNGVREGIFRHDLNLEVTRDVILGALDMETISCVVSREIEQSEPDFEDLTDMCLSMILTRSKPKLDRSKKADNILKAAIDVFAEKGFNKAKISDIAAKAEVADATIYEYFPSKLDLLLSIPTKHIERFHKGIMDAFVIKSPVGRLRRLIKYHCSSFMTDRNFFKIFLLELQLKSHFYASKSYETYKQYIYIFEQEVEHGKDVGVFRSQVNPRIFCNLFLGSFSHMALRWLIFQEKTDTDKMQEIEYLTDMLMSSLVEKQSDAQ
jgi:AcrR family transcriptional regulator